MTLTLWHIIGIAATLLLIVGVGVFAGRKVSGAEDFNSGGKSGAIVVAGAIMGTLVGGSSTVGTAQLAYSFGMSAWWFTLGGGISCLLLGLFFVGPLRRSGQTTIASMISAEFGQQAGMLASVLSSVGIFINLLAQLVSAQALITTIIPSIGLLPSTLFAAALMAVYVIFGGVLAAGLVGVVKLILLYIAVIISAILALYLSGGFGEMWTALPHETYFSLFARGVGTDAGAGLSLILGVLSTQSYAQAIISGKSDSASRKGAFISACMIPPIGAGGILVGYFMQMNYPDITASQAFPLFIMNHMPAVVAGVILATLLIATVGTGAGLSLGISTVMNNDIVKKLTRRFDDAKKSLLLSRVIILLVLAVALILTVTLESGMILNLAFLSMGLRAAVVFVPLCATLFLPGRVPRGAATAAIIAGPLAVLIGKFAGVTFDPLFIGIAASLVICLLGAAMKKKTV